MKIRHFIKTTIFDNNWTEYRRQIFPTLPGILNKDREKRL
jgi:hypothetical protein